MRGILSILESRKEKRIKEEMELVKEADANTPWESDGKANHLYALRKPVFIYFSGSVVEYGWKYKCSHNGCIAQGKICEDPDCRICMLYRK